MIHTWEEITTREKIDGVKFKVGDWVYTDDSLKSYGYIEKFTIYRNRDHTKVNSVTYKVRIIKLNNNYKFDKKITFSKDEAVLKEMNSELSLMELKQLADLSLDTRDKEYFMKMSALINQKIKKR